MTSGFRPLIPAAALCGGVVGLVVILMDSPCGVAPPDLGMVAGVRLVLVPVDMPGVEVGRSNPLTGACVVNFRTADLDGDGKVDLLFPTAVQFQDSGGRFPSDQRVPVPGFEESPAVDIWQGRLYLLYPARVVCLKWNGSAWETLRDQALASDEAGQPSALTARSVDRPTLRLEQFLQDIDGDGTPEILVPGSQGIRIFAERDGAYIALPPLNAYPPLHVADPPEQRLWPPETFFGARSRTHGVPGDLAVPACLSATLPEGRSGFCNQRRNRLCQVFALAADQRARPPNRSGLCATRPARCWNGLTGRRLKPVKRQSCLSHDLREHWRQDFAGDAHALLPSFVLFVDFDRDGALDMVTEETGFRRGRRALIRFATMAQVQHRVRVHLRDAAGTFPRGRAGRVSRSILAAAELCRARCFEVQSAS
jgi:hypothetical protein